MQKKQPVQIRDLLKNMPASDRPAMSAEELMLQVADISKQAAFALASERQANKQGLMDKLTQ